MNETPSISESNLKYGSKTVFKREKMQSGWGLHLGTGTGSGPLLSRLSDTLHSPTISEKMDRSGTVSRHRTPSISQKLLSAQFFYAVFDFFCNASFFFLKQIETRSCATTSTGSVSSRSRLKDVSNALTTSKELLKIINRIWTRADQPSSSMSVISALHAELERARLQVNHLIQERCLDKNDINSLIKRYAEEKASWKSKEHLAVEAAIGSVANELEVERKLRRRLESLNKKLGDELEEMKSSFMKVVKELESEKRAREITEQVCNELARNIDEDRIEVERLKSESVKLREEAEREREMLKFADKCREERVQMKLSEAKHRFDEKNSAISKLRKQLENFLGTKRDKHEQEDDRDVENVIHGTEDDLPSIELNTTSNKKDCKMKKLLVDEIKPRHSVSGQVSMRGTYLQRVASDGVERVREIEKEASRRSCFEERHKSIKGVADHVLPRECHSPLKIWEQSCSLRDHYCAVVQGNSSKSRMEDVRVEGQSTRRSRR
ncbi:hypothetical protein CDL12_11229 [Handroanthus impetiginosus]|uniref:Uncharacterized protein n=1 Tax=Handroanthus impetiginosus TaxID=429701 RepID=A0A2G9HFQ0_9LAMI|nr:hypothetical protein CDL12_11229 [Handroanthus impetiginosus]